MSIARSRDTGWSSTSMFRCRSTWRLANRTWHRSRSWGGSGRSEDRVDNLREPALLHAQVGRQVLGVGHQRIAVAVPLAAGIIVPQDRGGFFCLVVQTERQIALDETMQRLRDVGRG